MKVLIKKEFSTIELQFGFTNLDPDKGEYVRIGFPTVFPDSTRMEDLKVKAPRKNNLDDFNLAPVALTVSDVETNYQALRLKGSSDQQPIWGDIELAHPASHLLRMAVGNPRLVKKSHTIKTLTEKYQTPGLFDNWELTNVKIEPLDH